MKIKIKGFITSKKSELYSDCADNYAVNREHNKFAISDGVSKSFFPKVWSDILVKKYVNQKDWKNEEFIIECQKEWQSKIDEIVNQPETKWFTKSQYNRKDPALATFVGLQFIESEQKWIAQALGDSFLFFIPKDSNKIEIQLSSKVDPIVFDNFPDYFSSISIHPQKGKVKIKERPMVEGTFYLMTDALAEWFIQDTEQAIQKLKNIQNQEQFLVTIEDERNTNRLNDDDSAVLIIDISDDNKKEFTYSEPNEVVYLSDLIKKETEEIEESKKKETSLSESSSNSNTEENKSEQEEPSKDDNPVNETTKEIVEQSTEIVKSNDTISETNNDEETKSNETENLKEESTDNSSNISDEKQEEKLPEQTPNETTDNPKTKSIFDKF
ncbi:hypothetical protein SAMN05660909_05603 [Chitinophaga terrae (ex Kim and Jung 2007)]|uniref:Protein phosphatase 2C domain-containing protein n=1 Tax=Chitinophaga terrae (ex Kim and Jung 2007) TaxID=408074 RepID=A0A1H4GS19_9BACT|nr:hypothetical protein [Chitinophaga terrae (ex Kim and Jung 2007)]MDQ0110533.1 fructose-specific phosphotransferase system component IIB [Chitinophaga terrae (ex Kim and Jung 2007)]GEP93695.1 hypothetical protein CTE07_53400 [Chitinophaga terrae (ex Kim and Jung 2007)]SEB11638.1 hypothetical protein SAMN05660909_05603 [Chitinophaga terrae (ex Kim and Jung 2007)]